jgi:CheY-like chemotaxis protein
MENATYRALIVDDDPTILKLATLALKDEGFECATATNGLEALERVAAEPFDLVVVDLAMPLKHGHSVAVELLGLPRRPVIAILTGLIEPRLAKDLMARGVDDVTAKPVNFMMFAAKMKALVTRFQATAGQTAPGGMVGPDGALAPISVSDLNQRLLGMTCILPLSCIALDVYELTSDSEGDTTRVSAALERDPALLAEVLRIANGPRYNVSGGKVVDVEEAVLLIGQKRVGEMALANHALGAVTSTVVPWINAPLLSRRSIAAGVGVELLADGGHESAEGLLGAAIMHLLGRVVLGSLYPVQYGAVNEHCRRTGCPLSTAELHLFPETNVETLSRLLRGWNVPNEICEPLGVINHGYDRLASLSDSSRVRAELLKVAILIGELAVGQWDPWDVLEFPSRPVLKRLGIDDLGSCLEEVRTDLRSIERFRPSPSAAGKKPAAEAPPTTPARPVAFHHLCPETSPMLEPVLRSIGVRVADEQHDLPLVLNAIGADEKTIQRRLANACRPFGLVLLDKRQAGALGEEIASLKFPCSFGQFQAAFEALAPAAHPGAVHPSSPKELAAAS